MHGLRGVTFFYIVTSFRPVPVRLTSAPIETLCAQGRAYRGTFCGRSGPLLSRHFLLPLKAVPIETLFWPLKAVPIETPSAADQGRSVPIETLFVAAQGRAYRDTL